jgi:hypothetical protein
VEGEAGYFRRNHVMLDGDEVGVASQSGVGRAVAGRVHGLGVGRLAARPTVERGNRRNSARSAWRSQSMKMAWQFAASAAAVARRHKERPPPEAPAPTGGVPGAAARAAAWRDEAGSRSAGGPAGRVPVGGAVG